jgi:hypothetical protein
MLAQQLWHPECARHRYSIWKAGRNYNHLATFFVPGRRRPKHVVFRQIRTAFGPKPPAKATKADDLFEETFAAKTIPSTAQPLEARKSGQELLRKSGRRMW